MSKIISFPTTQYKRIKCEFCGTEYEYIKGDKIHILGSEHSMRTANGDFVGQTTALLQCPVCGMANKLERIQDKSE